MADFALLLRFLEQTLSLQTSSDLFQQPVWSDFAGRYAFILFQKALCYLHTNLVRSRHLGVRV